MSFRKMEVGLIQGNDWERGDIIIRYKIKIKV